MGDHLIIKCEKKDDLKAKYTSALKALAVLGVKLKTKEPQAGKMSGELGKDKPGEFYLVADAKTTKLEFRHNKTVQVLGMIDPKLVDDIEALKAIQKATGVSYKERIAALEAHKHAPSKADPRAIKQADADVALAAKVCDDLKARLPGFDKVTMEAAFDNPALAKALDAYAGAIGMTEKVAFVRAFRKGGDPAALYPKFIKLDNGKVGPINYYPESGVTDRATIVKNAYSETFSEMKGQKLAGFRAAIKKPTMDRLAQAEKDLKHMREVRAKLDK